MLVGAIIRDYKNYNSLNFVPITRNPDNRFSVYTGVNGVGKSAILEALNVFFNKGDWLLRKGGKKEEALLIPFFLIKKDKVSAPNQAELKKATNVWKKLATDNIKTPCFASLFELRDTISQKCNFDDYFFFGVDHTAYPEYPNPSLTLKILTTAFQKIDQKYDPQINEKGDATVFPYDNSKLFDFVETFYDFIYFPVEMHANDITKLQTAELQKIMGQNTLSVIRDILTKTENGTSIIDQISEQLSTFLSTINTEIKKENQDYEYKTTQGVRSRLSPADLADAIMTLYFNKVNLKVGTKSIPDLSSGEQRQILIDVLSAFLQTHQASERNIILALDEPEASLHTAKCIEQFLKCEKISYDFKHQFLVTTHWYGFLPLCFRGELHHLTRPDEKFNVESMQLTSGLANKNRIDDLELKSYFDFSASVLATSRSLKQKWLFCEGLDDATYLRAFLAHKNIRVVPLGGASNVIKVFEHIAPAITNKNRSKHQKMLFLYDTDRQTIPPPQCGDVQKLLFIRRLQMSSNGVSLYDPTTYGEYEQTEMEDCLVASKYYNAVFEHLRKNQNISAIMDEHFAQNQTDYARVSKLSGSKSFLKKKSIDAEKHCETIYNAIMESEKDKLKIAELYIKGMQKSDIPPWIEAVETLLTD